MPPTTVGSSHPEAEPILSLPSGTTEVKVRHMAHHGNQEIRL
jgi:hypothetical protein